MASIPPHIPSANEITASNLDLAASKQPHDLASCELLLRVYIHQRIKGQLRFYESRFKEFDANSGFMVGAGAAVMAISSIVSVVGVTQNSPEMACLTALLPALAALLASLRQLYQWDKQSALYKDAMLGLEEVSLLVPDADVFDKRAANVILPRLVQAAEDVFTSEINQWGQIALGLDDKEKDEEMKERLSELREEDRRSQGYKPGSFEDIGGGSPAATLPGAYATPPAEATVFPPPPPQEDGGVG
jgi:hypothetical protein